MTGSFGEMGNLLKQAQEMQRQIDKIKGELAETPVEGSAGGGAVRVEATCDGKVQKVHISEEAVSSGDRTMLEEMVTAAVRDALQKADERSTRSLSDLTGGMQLPGLL